MPLTGLSGVTSFDTVVTGTNHTLALDQAGRLWAWGSNSQGQLGIGNVIQQNRPVLVSLVGLTGVTSFDMVVVGGSYTLAFDQDGRLWAWGRNNESQLDIGSVAAQHRPVLVSLVGLTGVTSFNMVVAGSQHTLAFDQQGRLWAWGRNASGQLGIGNTSDQNRPVLVPLAGLSGVTSFDTAIAGSFHTLALDQQGRLWVWGLNGNGQLGIGNVANQNRPVLVSLVGLSEVTSFDAVMAGRYHTLAFDQQGRLWAWGNNGNGRLGDGTTVDRHRPVLMSLVGLNGATSFDTVAGGRYHTLALDQTGRLWAWGGNVQGQLGDGTTTDRHRPTQITFLGSSAYPLSITQITPQGFNIATTNQAITVTFDRQVLPTSPGTITLNNTALDLTSPEVTWTTDNNQSVLTIALPTLERNTQYNIEVQGFVSTLGGGMTQAYQQVFRTQTDIEEGGISITKVLQMPEGTQTPETTFIFDITPHARNGDITRAGELPLLNIPDITNTFSTQSVAFSTSDVGAINTDTNYYEVIRTSSNILEGVSFPAAGAFSYRITERADTFVSTPEQTMVFDSRIFEATFIVVNNEIVGGQRIEAVLIQLVDTDTGLVIEGNENKLSALEFVNTFSIQPDEDPTDPEGTGLRVSKEITTNWLYADLNHYFSFDVSVTAPALIVGAPLYRAYVIDTSTNEVVTAPAHGTLSSAPSTFGYYLSFQSGQTQTIHLRHNQTLVFVNTHTGATFSVYEHATGAFSPTVHININGDIVTLPGIQGEGLSTGEHTLGSTTNHVNFENAYSWSAPTGLVIANMSLALVLATLLTLVMFVAYRKRRSIETLPLA